MSCRRAFDYGALDRGDQPVRIRLDSTCVHVGRDGDKAQVAYVRDGALHRVEARHAVLACFHMMIPHIMPELPAPQRAALAQERQDADLLHQRAGAQLARLRQPQGQFDLGADGVPSPGVARFPGQPRRLSPSARSVRADAAAYGPRAGRAEPGARCARPVPHRAGQALCDDVRGFRGAHPRRPRPHARARAAFPARATSPRSPSTAGRTATATWPIRCTIRDDYDDSVLKVARQPFGPVAIANTDAGGDAWVHFAIDQADRAVKELLG